MNRRVEPHTDIDARSPRSGLEGSARSRAGRHRLASSADPEPPRRPQAATWSSVPPDAGDDGRVVVGQRGRVLARLILRAARPLTVPASRQVPLGVMDTAITAGSRISFETSPDRYRHWKLSFDGPSPRCPWTSRKTAASRPTTG